MRKLRLSCLIGPGVTLLMVLATLPMALRLVPINRHYGLRVPAAYVSEQQWLLMNQVSGIAAGLAGLLMLGFAAVVIRRYRQGRLSWPDKTLDIALGLTPLPPALLAVVLPYTVIP